MDLRTQPKDTKAAMKSPRGQRQTSHKKPREDRDRVQGPDQSTDSNTANEKEMTKQRYRRNRKIKTMKTHSRHKASHKK